MLGYVEMTKERYEEVVRIWKSIPIEKILEIGELEWDTTNNWEKLAEAVKPYELTVDEWFVAVY